MIKENIEIIIKAWTLYERKSSYYEFLWKQEVGSKIFP